MFDWIANMPDTFDKFIVIYILYIFDLHMS